MPAGRGFFGIRSKAWFRATDRKSGLRLQCGTGSCTMDIAAAKDAAFPHAGKEVSMKVLILSVTAGYGHHATAQAIGDMLKSKGAEVDTLDVYAYISNLIKTTIDKGYLFSSKHMQTLYRLVYQLAGEQRRKLFSLRPSIVNIINALGATKFARVITDRKPDVIICTHVSRRRWWTS